MRNYFFLLFGLLVAGCDQGGHQIAEPLSGLEYNAAANDARRYFGSDADLLAVCGASVGSGYYTVEAEKGFQPDKMSEGVIGLAVRSDGSPDIAHRDALKEMVVVSESGATITRLPNENDPRLGIWIATYPSGIVETYNLTKDDKGKLFVLWTGNRAGDSILPARVVSFVAACTAQ